METDRTPEPADEVSFRAGTVALCGRPNVGKSTLLNALVGSDLAVATRFPQTTRERLLGVWSEAGFQAVLVDTPGIHRAKSALNKFMVDEALRGAQAVDLVLMLAEAPMLADIAAAEAWEPGPAATAALESPPAAESRSPPPGPADVGQHRRLGEHEDEGRRPGRHAAPRRP
ncbi:GTPase [Nannocystis radixulma]|uniref:GTPase Era n=1 Tax=Nannocystis radixulma TaxID=2995305 RepID=A0ABT5BDV6_9BACT|nr:GTPase [Nannocystis radixulma]MDC0671618.1 50S ribosome-binding GTPase [Nannocystis radixulma]